MRELVAVFRERRALIRAFVARAVHDVEFRGAALALRARSRRAPSASCCCAARCRCAIRDPQRAIPLAIAHRVRLDDRGRALRRRPPSLRPALRRRGRRGAGAELPRLPEPRRGIRGGPDAATPSTTRSRSPRAAHSSTCSGTIDAVFDWHYELKRPKLLELYEKGKATTWNATDLDWDTDVDIEKMIATRQQMGGGRLINQLLEPAATARRRRGARRSTST